MLLLGVTAYDTATAAAKLGGLQFMDEVLFATHNGLWLLLRWSFLLVAATVLIVLTAKRASLGLRTHAVPLLALGAGLIGSYSGVSYGAAGDRGAI